MKTAKEFIERLQSDEAFAKAVSDGIQAKKDAGARDYTEALLPVAAELGYEITAEQVEALCERQSEVISEEELGKAAGGTGCLVAALILASASLGLVSASASTVAAVDSSSC